MNPMLLLGASASFLSENWWVVVIIIIGALSLLVIGKRVSRLERKIDSVCSDLEEIKEYFSKIKKEESVNSKRIKFNEKFLSDGPYDLDHIKTDPDELLNPTKPKISKQLDPRQNKDVKASRITNKNKKSEDDKK